MGRSPCCSKEGLNRGAWTKQEDFILSEYIRIHGEGGWRNLPLKAGLERCGKSCRLRWLNYLRPDIKRGRISPDEEDLIIRLHRLLGNRWSLIAGRLPGRTDNEIKNYWNTHLSKQLPSMKESNPNSTKKLKTRSKSPPLRNPVFKTTPMKITRAVSYPEMVRPNNSHGYGCRNPSSDEAFKLCNANKNANDSKSWCNLLVNDEFTEDDSERLAFAAANNLVGITEATNSTRFMSSLANERSPNSYKFGADAATLADSLLDFNDLSSPDCSIDFESEELSRRPSTFAAEANEFEVICPDRNLRRVNSFTVPHDQEIEEFYDNAHHTEWLNELDYLKNSSSVSEIATVGIR